MGNITTLEYFETGVSFELRDGEVFANATEMCQAFGKEPYAFLRKSSTKRYVEALRKNNGVDLIHTINGGNNVGTWIHEKLILKLAQWLDVDFEIWCDEKIAELLKDGVTEIKTPQTFEERMHLMLTESAKVIENQKMEIVEKSKIISRQENDINELDEENQDLYEENVSFKGVIESITRGDGDITRRTLANKLNWTEPRLTKYLFENNILLYTKDGGKAGYKNWFKYVSRRDYIRGGNYPSKSLLITPSGQKGILEFIAKNDSEIILKIIEDIGKIE